MSGLKINVEYYENKIYNNYKIIKFLYFKNYKRSRQPFYKCICNICKNEKILGLWSLKSNKGSGCIKCRKHSSKLKEGESIINNIFYQYSKNALKRNYIFKITK